MSLRPKIRGHVAPPRASLHFVIPRPRVLLPTGSEEREVFGVESIFVAILPSCQYMKILHYNCTDMNITGSKNKKHLRGSTQAIIHPLGIILTAALWALVSIMALGSIVAPLCFLY